MQESDSPVSRWHDWKIPGAMGLLGLLIYLTTLSGWVTSSSLPVLAQVSGWDDQAPITNPILYLATLPLRVLPDSVLPLAANVFTAIVGSLCLVLVARCVQLLPQDRTHAQRARLSEDSDTLTGSFAWVPPVFAAGLLGLQRTYWEHATALSGEMMLLFVFALVVWCLLEYRSSRRDGWLKGGFLLVGLGMASNWAMVGFLPAFLIAYVWIEGTRLLDWQRVLRISVYGLAGLALYLLMPWVCRGTGGLPEGFWDSLGVVLNTQKAPLLGIPKTRFLMLATVMVLPLVAIGIRTDFRGSGFERLLSAGLLLLLQIVWLFGCVYMTFDGEVSPRQLITLDPGYGGIPLLTFSFTAALIVGYYSGYFLMLGLVEPEKRWNRPKGMEAVISKGFAWMLVVASVGVPAALAYRNYPALRYENGPLMADLAEQWTGSLPDQPSLVLSDQYFPYTLLLAWQHKTGGSPRHLIFLSRSGVDPKYRKSVAQRHGDGETWPELQEFAEIEVNVAGRFLALVLRLAQEGRAYHMSAPQNFLSEYFAAEPQAGLFRLRPFQPGEIGPLPLSDQQAAQVTAWWEARSAWFTFLEWGNENGSPGARVASQLLSRTANLQGLRLQQSEKLPQAADLFQVAIQLSEDNIPAKVNHGINRKLQAGTSIEKADRSDLETRPLSPLLEMYGPVDEPVTLMLMGEAALRLQEPLARSAAVSFQRVLDLQPDNADAAIGFAQAAAAAGELEMTKQAIDRARAMAERKPLTTEQKGRLTRIQAATEVGSGRMAEAQTALRESFEANPDDVATLDLLMHLHERSNTYEELLPLLESAVEKKPNQQPLRERLGLVYLRTGRGPQAVQAFTHILERDSTHAPSRVNRATSRLMTGDLDGARLDFQWLLDQDRELVRARIGLASLAESQGNLNEARRHVERALDKAAPRSAIHTNLVMHLERLKTGSTTESRPQDSNNDLGNPPPDSTDASDPTDTP